jgi:hypothetical protein
MKTIKTNIIKRILLFSTAVFVSCLLSIMVPKASERESALPVVSPDEWSYIDQEEPETRLEVEDWMLDLINQ